MDSIYSWRKGFIYSGQIKTKQKEQIKTKPNQPTNLTKKPKMPKQISLQKYHWVSFIFTLYCWACGLPLSLVYIPSETPLQKIYFCFASWCQLQMASWLGLRACVYFPSRWWHSGLLPKSLWIYVYFNKERLPGVGSLVLHMKVVTPAIRLGAKAWRHFTFYTLF